MSEKTVLDALFPKEKFVAKNKEEILEMIERLDTFFDGIVTEELSKSRNAGKAPPKKIFLFNILLTDLNIIRKSIKAGHYNPEHLPKLNAANATEFKIINSHNPNEKKILPKKKPIEPKPKINPRHFI